MSKCLCITCGTTEDDPITGYCKNDHDNWLEPKDEIKYFKEASTNLNKTIDEVYNSLMNGEDLSI
jgi:hypothetical protein